jgi:hypothetical protein
MATKYDVGMQVEITQSLDLFGIAKTIILKSVSAKDSNIISFTEYTFDFYPLEPLPASPKSGQIVYEISPPTEY